MDCRSFYQWHIGNAWEEGHEMFIDMVKYADFSSNKALGNLIHGDGNTGELNGRLTRLRFNPRTGVASPYSKQVTAVSSLKPLRRFGAKGID